MEILEFVTHYLIVPLITIICTMGWRMIKKQDDRLDSLENRANDTEKSVIEIRTEIRKDIQYLSQDIKEIKELILKNKNV